MTVIDNFLRTVEPYRIDNSSLELSDEPIKDASVLKPAPDVGVLLIAGDGWNVVDDLSKFLDLGVSHDLMCMNYSAKIVPKNWPIKHYIAGDSHMPDMQAQAVALAGKGVLRHCWNRKSRNFDVRWERNTTKPWNGTTTNLGVKIGMALGYMRIVLAGCPMDGGGNWYTKSLIKDDVKKYKDHTAHLWKWTEIASRPIGRFIKSMSGNTADLFGTPTKEWLENI